MSKKTAKQITRSNRDFIIIRDGAIFLQESGDPFDVIRRKLYALEYLFNRAKTNAPTPYHARALRDIEGTFEDLDNYITAVQSLQTIQPFAL
jgi:hypothetical protein